MARVLLVAGTHGRRDPAPWWTADAPFVRALREHGHEVIGPRGGDAWRLANRGWGWSTALDGVCPGRRRRVWRGAGYSLKEYATHFPGLVQAVIAHSHGGNVAAYALSYGLRVPVVVTIATPVRHDLRRVYVRARARVDRWYHVSTPGDWWQLAGALFDGRLGVHRWMPGARNVRLQASTDAHRAGLDPAVWTREGWWAWLA